MLRERKLLEATECTDAIAIPELPFSTSWEEEEELVQFRASEFLKENKRFYMCEIGVLIWCDAVHGYCFWMCLLVICGDGVQ